MGRPRKADAGIARVCIVCGRRYTPRRRIQHITKKGVTYTVSRIVRTKTCGDEACLTEARLKGK